MKNLLIILCFVLGYSAFAQSEQHLEFPLTKNKASLSFPDCNLINVRGWEKDYIEIAASININGGKNNSAFEITSSSGLIEGIIKNKKDLPKMIRIQKGDETFLFETSDFDSPEIKAFYKEHGKDNISWTSHGIIWEITINIMVPSTAQLDIFSKHGLIEIENFNGQVTANSKHGGIDFSSDDDSNQRFVLSSDWGEIYSNLNLSYNTSDLEKNSMKNHIQASINNGNGSLIQLESKHGNIYLRRAE